MVSCPREILGYGIDTQRGSGNIVLALRLETGGPLPHHLFVEELDGEIFDAGIASPPDLNAVRACRKVLASLDAQESRCQAHTRL
jgi:hypothetical protein